jgi:methylenetetrahydrofolate reductase (NADPH)
MSNDSRTAPVFSCEFFPPKTDAGMEKLLAAQNLLQEKMHPAFFSVTFGAGGSTRDRTLETVNALTSNGASSVAPHISCMGSSKTEIKLLLDTYIASGIKRLVTLRGDVPQHGSAQGDLEHASDLVSFIRDQTGDHFHIEVAAYPEYHPESATPQSDFDYFSAKVKSGANSAITQYFYNVDAYLRFVDKCDTARLNIPVVPGIMPITNFTSLARFSDLCGAEIPRWIRKQLEAFQNDAESLRSFGTDVVTELCNQLLDSGAPGLHFYALNQSDATLDISQSRWTKPLHIILYASCA